MRKLRHEEIQRVDPSEISSLPRHPVRVVVDNVRSLYNVGSIFRTSDAAGVERIYLTGYSGTPEHAGLHRTALGAQDAVAWEKHEQAEPLLREIRSAGYTLAALEITDTPRHVAELEEADFPLCLIVGNEVDGVSQHLLDLCQLAIEIPQYGMKQSLNVSVAYGVAVFGIVERFRALTGIRET